MKSRRSYTLEKTLPYILIICGAIGFIAAMVIMLEKLHLLADPTYRPLCSLNPIISCGSVMSSWQGSAFGFPNPLIGIAAFPMVVGAGFALLAGAQLKRWFWLWLQVGVTFGALFIHWLFYQSVYNIGALCPYCMVVWAMTMPLFWYVTLYNLRQGHIKLPKRISGVGPFLQRHHGDALIAWFLFIICLIAMHFWYFWETLV